MIVPITTQRRKRIVPLPDAVPAEPVCRITVKQYHEMIRAGIFGDDEPIELLEGWLVRKMPNNTPHSSSSNQLRDLLVRLLPETWSVRSQDPITLADSEPEPDLVVVRGHQMDYQKRHPEPNDFGIVIEISETSLSRDKGWKKSIYAGAGLPTYWIVNLPDSVIEVFTDPTGHTKNPDYRQHQIFTARQRVPVMLDGKKAGTLLAADVLLRHPAT